ncbi:MAG TPA: hypothetical protein VFI29_09095 [Hanamia sp.]|nr:hypothetical protein [Hanamia sp.]
MSKSNAKTIRNILGVLLLLVAINAFGGGYYGMAGAIGVPIEWLQGSPFTSYFIPGLFLFTVIGGWALFASILVFMKKKFAPKAALISSEMVLLWLVVQISIIGYVSWMQPTTAVAAVLIILLAWNLPNCSIKT